MKHELAFSIRNSTFKYRPLRVMLLILSIAAIMSAQAAPPGPMMKVLDKDGKSKVVYLPPSTRPQISEAAFDSTTLETGYYRGRRFQFFVRDGWALIDGDIALGRAADLTRETNSATFAQHDRMWPKVGSVYQVPYLVTSGNTNITIAINYFNATFPGVIQWVPRVAQADYVDFNLNPGDFSGSGFSSLGRAGGAQQLGGAINLSVVTLLHEMGHAIGLYHEQARADRNIYVEYHPENMSNATRSNSAQFADYFQLDSNIQDVGLYDYASVMHYAWNTFAKNENAVLESIPHGIPLSRFAPNPAAGDYSEGDIDGIKRLYDSTPAPVTITSNPSGLQVIVDGSTITTPQTFNWFLNSTHSLSIPTGGQTLGGKAYVYGRWNDNAATTHNITVTSGDGRRVSPQDRPAVTVYSANFISLIKFTQDVFPAAAGTMTATPAALSYAGLSGVYYVARQPVVLQATPNAGQNFYAWFNIPVFAFSRNPETFRWDVDVPNAEINAQAGFSNQPIYTFTANPANQRVSVLVDSIFFYAPVNYSPFYDGALWNAGTTHSLNTDSPQFPFDFGTRQQFQNWSDAGAQSHNITLPAGSASYTANFTTQHRALVETPCGGTPALSPFSADGFYNAGTFLTVSQTPLSGYVFTGWREDLMGTTSPQILTLNDQLYAIANYNVNSTPFSVTSLSPASVAQNSPGFTLTINGTGFTSNQTSVFVNNQFRANTFINSTQITVPVLPADLTTAGGISIFAQNFPNGGPCGVFNNRALLVQPASPTGAAVTVSGYVQTADNGLAGRKLTVRGVYATVTLTDFAGNTFTTLTNKKDGSFQIADVPIGQTYLVNVSARGYQFPSRLINLSSQMNNLNFLAEAGFN